MYPQVSLELMPTSGLQSSTAPLGWVQRPPRPTAETAGRGQGRQSKNQSLPSVGLCTAVQSDQEFTASSTKPYKVKNVPTMKGCGTAQTKWPIQRILQKPKLTGQTTESAGAQQEPRSRAGQASAGRQPVRPPARDSDRLLPGPPRLSTVTPAPK